MPKELPKQRRVARVVAHPCKASPGFGVKLAIDLLDHRTHASLDLEPGAVDDALVLLGRLMVESSSGFLLDGRASISSSLEHDGNLLGTLGADPSDLGVGLG